MQKVLSLRYLKATVKKPKKAVIKPVNIDFPLPDKVQGIENRLNSLNTYKLPETFFKKNQPVTLVGQNLRLSHLLSHWE